ncbi:MAG: hypothetical protein WBR24_23085 [Desulfobacterales bacterium]|jgi:hypothetical protein
MVADRLHNEVEFSKLCNYQESILLAVMKGDRMWSKLAIGTLFIGIILLGYHVLGGVLGLGYSDQIKFAPQSPIGFLGPERFEWINSLPNEMVQKFAHFIVQTPLYALIFGMSLLFFIIHFIVPDNN